MIKHLFGKKTRKHSKPAGNSVPSLKKNGGEIKKSSSTTGAVASGPQYGLIIGNYPENRLLKDKNEVRLNASLASASYEMLPSFRDVPGSDRPDLFVRKLKMCCIQFDFVDPTKNLKEKEIKRQTLLELVDYVTSAGNGKFGESAVQEVVDMVSANIFREFMPQPRENKLIDGVDLEEEEPAMDPAWPHLQIVYEFLLRFVASTETDPKVAKRYMDQSFVLKLLDLFDSEDPRERECLKMILHRMYGKFMVHRPFIRKAINNIFYRFVFETERHNGIAEFLEVLGSIINGFTLPLKEEHKLFLVRTMIPLHKPKCLAMYHQQLCYCILQFVEKDFKLADTIIQGLIKYWPVTNSSKEVLFLNELEEVLELTQPAEFQRCMVPLFRKITHSLSSLHLQVAERALLLWNNEHVANLIKLNRKAILPIIFPSIEKNARHHWNQAVHSLSLNVRKTFMDLDLDLFKACQIKFQDEESKENEARARREAAWRRIEELAARKHPE